MPHQVQNQSAQCEGEESVEIVQENDYYADMRPTKQVKIYSIINLYSLATFLN